MTLWARVSCTPRRQGEGRIIMSYAHFTRTAVSGTHSQCVTNTSRFSLNLLNHILLSESISQDKFTLETRELWRGRNGRCREETGDWRRSVICQGKGGKTSRGFPSPRGEAAYILSSIHLWLAGCPPGGAKPKVSHLFSVFGAKIDVVYHPTL